MGCDRLLKDFWKDAGLDDDDWPVGHIVRARPSWIEKEKKFFAKNFGSSKQPESSANESSDEVVEVPAKRQRTPRRASDEPRKKKARHDSTLSRSPIQSGSLPPTKSTKQGKPSRKFHDDDDIEDSDEAPISRLSRKKSRKVESDFADMSEIELETSDDEPIRRTSKPMVKTKSTKAAVSRLGKSDKGKGRATSPPLARATATTSEDLTSLFSAPSSPEAALARELPPETAPETSANKAPIKKPSTINTGLSNATERRPSKASPIEAPKGAVTGITTKMRLAQAAKTLSLPSKATTSSSVQRNSLAKLSFKKNTGLSNAATTPVQETPSRPLPHASGSRPGMNADAPLFTQSPVHNNLSSPDSATPRAPLGIPRRPAMPLPRRTVSAPQPPSESTAVVDQFLSTIMPPELAAPMEEINAGMDALPPPVAVRPPVAAKPPVLGRIPKKWKWTGEVFVEVEAGKAQRLCNVTMSDATDPRPNGLRFSICLTTDSIRLQKIYGVADFYMVMQACSPVQQFAKVGPQDDGDAEALKAFTSYLRRRRSFTYARLILDDVEVALLLLFPLSLFELRQALKVPQELVDANALVAALVPWELSWRTYEDALWLSPRSLEPSQNRPPAAVFEALQKSSIFPNTPLFHRVLRILKVPRTLLDFMSTPNRPYCLWYANADGVHPSRGYETKLLQTFLTICKARDVGIKADVRAVFVHIGALATLYKLPALAERRYKRPDLRFYTYGSHENVSPDRWGIREIFPLGGVVTFTPAAVIENIVGTYELIKKIDEHPLWQCYILPSVVAMLAMLTCQDQAPLTLFDQGEFLLDGLLDLIVQGKLSLLRAPTTNHSTRAKKWIGWQLQLLDMDARTLLDECIRTAKEQYNDVKAELADAIQKEIARDLWALQMQPAVMDEYRRLVVVKSKSSDRYFTEDKEGIECVSLSQFDFKDAFFTSED